MPGEFDFTERCEICSSRGLIKGVEYYRFGRVSSRETRDIEIGWEDSRVGWMINWVQVLNQRSAIKRQGID